MSTEVTLDVRLAQAREQHCSCQALTALLAPFESNYGDMSRAVPMESEVNRSGSYTLSSGEEHQNFISVAHFSKGGLYFTNLNSFAL